LLLATDGLTLVRNQTTGEWRTEATDSVKSLRLSSEVAFSLWVDLLSTLRESVRVN